MRFEVNIVNFTNKKIQKQPRIDNLLLFILAILIATQLKEKLQLAKRQKHWINAIRRDDLFRNKEKLAGFLRNGRICKKHFKSGQPAHFDDRRELSAKYVAAVLSFWP
jgi:hypothetical protein